MDMPRFYLVTLLLFFELLNRIGAYPSNWAYAYIENRSVLDAANIHINAKYVYKLDLEHFFDSIDKEIITAKLEDNYLFNSLLGNRFNQLIADMATLNNKLPQGSPLSPLISNLIMIGFDHYVANHNDIKNNHIKYTRYADDLILSSEKYISPNQINKVIQQALTKEFGDKIKINKEKCKLLTNKQRLYILGVKLNKDNNLTFGHEKKKALKLEMYNLFKRKQAGELTKEEAQCVLGLFNFMKQIEPEYAKYLERKLCKQFQVKKSIYKYFLS